MAVAAPGMVAIVVGAAPGDRAAEDVRVFSFLTISLTSDIPLRVN